MAKNTGKTKGNVGPKATSGDQKPNSPAPVLSKVPEGATTFESQANPTSKINQTIEPTKTPIKQPFKNKAEQTCVDEMDDLDELEASYFGDNPHLS